MPKRLSASTPVLFDDAGINEIERYAADEAGREGSVKKTRFTLSGRESLCIDSPIEHEFGFTPAISLFVQCPRSEEVDRLFAALSEGGRILMPLDQYPFSLRFA